MDRNQRWILEPKYFLIAITICSFIFFNSCTPYKVLTPDYSSVKLNQVIQQSDEEVKPSEKYQTHIIKPFHY